MSRPRHRKTLPVKCLRCGSVYEYRGGGKFCICPHCRRPSNPTAEKAMKIPKGWRKVTSGLVKRGDKFHTGGMPRGWNTVQILIGGSIPNYDGTTFIRKVRP